MKMSNSLSKINHFVVFMLENRSFDNMLGRKYNPKFDSLSNPLDPNDKTSQRIKANAKAVYSGDLQDPGHNIKDVNTQLFGTRKLQYLSFILLRSFCRYENSLAEISFKNCEQEKVLITKISIIKIWQII